ncbi:hypothetical protein PSCICJ_11850 [Pseudomonas cichorii]|nr:hypothetical protein PSCICJ_11850 [Pseudomonas cichorii]
MSATANVRPSTTEIVETLRELVRLPESLARKTDPRGIGWGPASPYRPSLGIHQIHSLSVCSLCHRSEPVMGSVCWSVGANSESKQKEIMK